MRQGDRPRRIGPGRARPFSFAATGLSAGIGLVALIGWAADVRVLRSVSRTWVAMNPLTAVLVIALAAATAQRLGGTAGGTSWARAAAFVIFLFGALTLLGTVGLDVGLDTLMFKAQLGSGAAVPNRMAPNTALCFALLGLGGIAVRRHHLWSARLFALALVVAGLALIGYLYNAGALAQYRTFIPMAVNTAVALSLLAGVGLLESQQHPLIARFTADDLSGTVARRLLGPIVAIPLVVGWIRLLAERAGLLAPTTAVAVMVLCTVGLLLAVAAFTIGVIQRLEIHRRVLADEREELIAGLQGALSESQDAVSAGKEQRPGFVIVCSGCKKVPDEAHRWEALEVFVNRAFGTQFSHGICPPCTAILYPEFHARAAKRAAERQERGA